MHQNLWLQRTILKATSRTLVFFNVRNLLSDKAVSGDGDDDDDDDDDDAGGGGGGGAAAVVMTTIVMNMMMRSRRIRMRRWFCYHQSWPGEDVLDSNSKQTIKQLQGRTRRCKGQ